MSGYHEDPDSFQLEDQEMPVNGLNNQGNFEYNSFPPYVLQCDPSLFNTPFNDSSLHFFGNEEFASGCQEVPHVIQCLQLPQAPPALEAEGDKEKLRTLHKTNMRLLKKLQLALSFVQGLNCEPSPKNTPILPPSTYL